MDAIEIKIRADKNLISLPLGAIRTYAEQFFKDKKTVEKIVLALEEALNNIFSYGMSGRLNDIMVTADANDGEFTISVIDKGLPGDYEKILEGEDRIGLTLMEKSVDEFYIENMGPEGKKQKLIKYYASLPEQAKIPESNENILPDDIKLDFRVPKKEDMLKISRAFYNEYGLTYFHDVFYYPDRLFAAISKGKIHSTVAIDQYGGFAGHHAAMQWSILPGIWEAGMAIVNSSYRNMGIFKTLMGCTHNYVQNEAKGKMVMGCCVTTHPYSQMGRLKAGSFPCAFAFNVFPPEAGQSTFKGEGRPTTEGIAATIYDFTPKTVFLDKEVTPVAEFIYGGMKLERKILNEPQGAADETTISKCAYNAKSQSGEINLMKIGDDYESRLSADIFDLKKKNCKILLLYASLENPLSLKVYETAKNLGFFFTGILPNADQGDVIRMQKMLTDVIDYDSIITAGAYTTLLEMLRPFDPDNKK